MTDKRTNDSPINCQDLINCGERRVQKSYRIALKEILERHGITIGQAVEVYIRKI